MKKKQKKWIFTAAVPAFAALAGWMIWENTALETTHITVSSERLPRAFDGFRIVHVSDLHNTVFGEHNQKLLDRIRNAEPDIIAITGDLLDSYHTNLAAALEFAEEARRIAPCYYVPGNHESRISAYHQFKKGLTARGVVVLEDRAMEIIYKGQTIHLVGLIDSSFSPEYPAVRSHVIISRALEHLVRPDTYTLLLSHRPDLFDTYAAFDVDLVLSGHAHGGQIRLPFVGAVFAPNQGFFPKYDAGLYRKERTQMVVSRGLGNSSFPIRVHNRPEVIAITLRAE